ncbi:LytR/AlgR family response regulator transcription factor [Marixanthomonas spongiae]|uniref:DNA-binding response regulator n=1 Tax=Marixanthomonas spongiae TaxID=2174845 RepID=A0A2U0HVI1_9FLAO|nr:LytTR family DNA-binding domain-containing protein [Marixanthomonas spongiae]PVW12844.1 DNA-binding response regulator [Marixanthomonas spongiae]
MVKVMVIDDEQHCIDHVVELLASYKEEYVLVATAKTVADALKIAKEQRPDLVFLDVQIGPNTGFDFLEQVGPASFDVIFTTAYDRYALKAIKFSALDYLLKPIGTKEFATALERFKTHTTQHMAQRIAVLLQNMEHQNALKKITVPTSEGYEFLEVDQILRCEADKNYTHIHLKNGKKITVSKTLKTFEELLATEQFFRVHNSHLINLNEVKKYVKGKGGYVIMTNNHSIEVSTRRKEQFLEHLKR